MSDAHDLANLEFDIDRMRARIALDRRLLGDQLGPAVSLDTVDELLTQCDEFGADYVADQIASSPQSYNLDGLPLMRLEAVRQLLARLSEASDDFDTLVGARESLLAKADPNHRRTYPWFGREFVLADNGRTLRFADASAAPEPATITPVANRTAPTVRPDAVPSATRRRRRDRDR